MRSCVTALTTAPGSPKVDADGFCIVAFLEAIGPRECGDGCTTWLRKARFVRPRDQHTGLALANLIARGQLSAASGRSRTFGCLRWIGPPRTSVSCFARLSSMPVSVSSASMTAVGSLSSDTTPTVE